MGDINVKLNPHLTDDLLNKEQEHAYRYVLNNKNSCLTIGLTWINGLLSSIQSLVVQIRDHQAKVDELAAENTSILIKAAAEKQELEAKLKALEGLLKECIGLIESGKIEPYYTDAEDLAFRINTALNNKESECG